VKEKSLLKTFSIIHTDKKEPPPFKSEEVHNKADALRRYIRVIPAGRTTTMDRASRVCYSKIYTVEYYLKVMHVGDVHPEYRDRLKKQWKDFLDKASKSLEPSFPSDQPVVPPMSSPSIDEEPEEEDSDVSTRVGEEPGDESDHDDQKSSSEESEVEEEAEQPYEGKGKKPAYRR
jgi:hypothetical protein